MPSYTVKSDVLSSSTAYCYQRKLARASDGTLWCVYHRSDGTYYQIYVSYSTDGGETWIEEQVTKVAGHQYWPSIAIDGEDNVHVVWHGVGWGSNPSYENIQYRKRTSSGWQAQEAVTDKDNTQCFSSIAVDSEGNIHIAWCGKGWGSNPDYYNIQYRKRTSSGWQPQEAVTDKDEGQTNVSIAIDSNDNVHVIWKGPGWGSNPSYYNIQYRKRTSSGWEKQEAVTDKDEHQVNPCVAVDSEDNVHVVWHGAGWGSNPSYYNIQYRKRTSSGWQAQEAVTDANNGQYNPSIAIDNEDNVHVVWRGLGWGANPSYYNIQHRKRTNTGWERQEGLTDAHTDQYYPNLIWALHPTIFGLKTCRPKTGYAFVWVDGTTLKFYRSNDFTASTLLRKEIRWRVTNLSDWQYKKRITIAGSSGAGTNYQVLLKVGESSGASGCDFHVEGHSSKFPSDINDGGDLRFTDNAEANLLNFWVEKVEGSSPNRVAYCWVKVTDDLGSDVDIYCFYGNPSATSVSDGEATFEFFEDFETWEGWTQYSGGQVSQSSARVYNGTYSAHKTTNDDPAGAYKPLPSSLGRNIALEVMVNRNSNFSGGSADRIGVIDDNGDGYGVGYQHDQNKIFLDVRTNYSGTVTWGPENTDRMDVWYKLVLKIEPSYITGEKWYQGTQEGTVNTTNTSTNTFTRFYIFGGHDYWVDLARIRKYVSPEPSFSSAGNEEMNQLTHTVKTGGYDQSLAASSQRKLARTSDGTLWCVYSRSDGTHYQIYASYSTDGGETWVEEQVSYGTDTQDRPGIAVDSEDNVHVVWRGLGWGDNPTKWNLQYRKRTSAGWQPQEAVTDESANQEHPSIAVDSNDNVHIVWLGLGWGTNTGYYNIQYRKRTSSGWQSREAVSDIGADQLTPMIAIDDDNNIHVVWRGTGWGTNTGYHNIQYRKRTSTGWESQEAVTDKDADQVNPVIAVDSGDNVCVVWFGKGWGTNTGNWNIQYRKRTSTGWEPQEAVTDKDADQTHPTIATDRDDNIHVVWRGLGWGTNTGYYNIQYRKRTSAGWQAQEGLTDTANNHYFPNNIWALHPTLFGLKTNRPRTGYAFVWVDGTTIKFRKSSDFTASTLLRRKTKWQLLIRVGLNSQWRIFEELNKNVAWQILATKTISKIIEWKLLNDQDISSAWKLLNISEADSRWMILGESDLSLSWKLLTQFSEATSWKILNEFGKGIAWKLLLTKSKDTSWQILALNIVSKLVAWKLLTQLGKNTAWRVLDRVERYTSWKSLASKDKTTTWKLLTSLDATSSWRLLSEFSRGISWKLITAKDKSLSWQILLLYTSSRDLMWKLVTADDISSKWRILTGTELGTSWKLLDWLNKDASWRVLGELTTPFVWKILNEGGRKLSWKVLSRKDKELLWAILSKVCERDIAWKILTSREIDVAWLVGLLAEPLRELVLDSPITGEGLPARRMLSVFMGDVVDVILNVGCDTSTATAWKIKYRKPDGQVGAWDAVVDDDPTRIRRKSVIFDKVGWWEIQACIESPPLASHGKIAHLFVRARL